MYELDANFAKEAVGCTIIRQKEKMEPQIGKIDYATILENGSVAIEWHLVDAGTRKTKFSQAAYWECSVNENLIFFVNSLIDCRYTIVPS